MTHLSREKILQKAEHYYATKKWYRALSQRAAVAIVVQERPLLGPCLLMIQRAEREGDPWSGQMAFPGGKRDAVDEHITHTALREVQEELGIEPALLHRCGRLSDILARPYRLQQKPMVVSPLLFASDAELVFNPNEEVADVLWVPLAHFLNPEHRQSMSWAKYDKPLNLPCYYYQEKRIWGLSLLMIDELVNKLL